MAKQDNTDKAKNIKLNWQIPEYKKYDRSKRWYIISIIIVLAFLAYSLLTANLLFGFIVIIGTVTYYFMDRNEPHSISFSIESKGLQVGTKFFDYSDIDKFYIIYEPGDVKSIFFEFKNPIKPRLSIPLNEQNPITIREELKKYLTEDLEKEGEPLTESFGNIFKL